MKTRILVYLKAMFSRDLLSRTRGLSIGDTIYKRNRQLSFQDKYTQDTAQSIKTRPACVYRRGCFHSADNVKNLAYNMQLEWGWGQACIAYLLGSSHHDERDTPRGF